MPLWLLFTLVFVVLVVSTISGVWFFTTTVLYPLIPSDAWVYVTSRAVLLDGFVLLVVLVLFILLGRLIALPARRLTQAADAFAKNGERIPVVIPSFAPREVKRLARSFVELVGSVVTAHKRDVEVSRVKSDFITTAAHQLRTPLTGIRWALEALEKTELTEDQKALAKSAADKSHELVTIVGTLLDISAIESGKYKYTFESIDISALVAEVVNDLQIFATERNVSLYLAKAESVPLVRADRERIKWVISNLVENGIRYTPAGGKVTLGILLAPERVYVTVRDTGIGISPRDSANIFERFFRAGNAVAKENEGNGLGLYIARTIATDHGGDLNFKPNSEGPGTSFTLSLPMSGPPRT